MDQKRTPLQSIFLSRSEFTNIYYSKGTKTRDSMLLYTMYVTIVAIGHGLLKKFWPLW